MNENNPSKSIFFVLLFFLMATLSGCGSTYQARRVKTSGFLDNYSMMKEGSWGESLLVYYNPDVNNICPQYDKILLDPVTIWVKDKDSSLNDVSQEDRQMLTDYFYDSLHEAFSKNYQIVSRPGPGVLRIRAALTEAEGSWVILDTVTSILPMALATSILKQVAFGTASFVADATVEFEAQDSLTQQTLIAAVDRRAGGKGFAKKFNQWGKVEKAFDYWAEKAEKRFLECKAGKLDIKS